MDRYRGFLMLLALAGLALLALGALPTRRLAGEGGLAAMMAGVALGVLSGALSCLPSALKGPARTSPGASENAVVLALGATGLRIGIVALGGVTLALATELPKVPLVVWIGISYLALLPLETRFLLKSATERADERPLETS